MRVPKGLQPLVDDGYVDAVVRQLKSGKEASVFVVECDGQLRCAKVYKDAQHRGFHKLAEYQAGRRARRSRDARAAANRGRRVIKVQDDEW
jgi:RIO kinase 1